MRMKLLLTILLSATFLGYRLTILGLSGICSAVFLCVRITPEHLFSFHYGRSSCFPIGLSAESIFRRD